MADDDRLPTLWASLPPSSHYFSLEFFPPKTASGFSNLQSRLARMAAALRPLFVTVTWGAGGSTATKSLELAEVCQRQLGLTTVLHLTCTNMKRSMVDEALESAKEVGIRNILALRGDPPREEYRDTNEGGSGGSGTDSNDEFVWAVDLVRYIRRKYGDYFSVGVAGYPEGHADESNPEAGKQSVEHDLPYLVEKVAAGADFIMTQLTYDITAYHAFEKRLREYQDKDGHRLFEKIPIIPGLMPIQSYQIIKRITKLSHAKIPEDISRRIEAVKSDDEAVKKVGVDILSELVDQIKALPQPDGVPRGFHFYTLNLEKSVAFILERTGLIPPISEPEPEDISASDSEAIANDNTPLSNGTATGTPAVQNGTLQTPKTGFAKRRTSSVNAQPHNRVILEREQQEPLQKAQAEADNNNNNTNNKAETNKQAHAPTEILKQHVAPNRGTGIPASDPTRKHNLMISEGQGALGREATWDDFPNGRWGPSHSPAFGEIDGYGPTLKVGPITARRLWNHPKTRHDVTDLFRRHVVGELEAVPWSDEIDVDSGAPAALRAETQVIRQELLGLIEKKGYWTLASQPAVDGVRSEDETFGWGPPGEGFVFQKAFVEFFCPRQEWERNLRPRLIKYGPEQVGWLKTDAFGLFESSEQVEEEEDDDRHQNSGDGGNKDDDKNNNKTNGFNDDHNTKDQPSQPAKPPRTSASSSPSAQPTTGSGFNAVTWGVFRGKEIVSPTIIEAESFRAWGEEAYSIWSEWRRCFPRGSEEERFLERMRQESVLVNVVGHKYIGGHAGDGAELWEILLQENS